MQVLVNVVASDTDVQTLKEFSMVNICVCVMCMCHVFVCVFEQGRDREIVREREKDRERRDRERFVLTVPKRNAAHRIGHNILDVPRVHTLLTGCHRDEIDQWQENQG